MNLSLRFDCLFIFLQTQKKIVIISIYTFTQFNIHDYCMNKKNILKLLLLHEHHTFLQSHLSCHLSKQFHLDPLQTFFPTCLKCHGKAYMININDYCFLYTINYKMRKFKQQNQVDIVQSTLDTSIYSHNPYIMQFQPILWLALLCMLSPIRIHPWMSVS